MIDFKIVEYNPSYAAKVADMWTKSGDSWGGYNIEFTEESIRQKEEISAHINCYLAVIGNEVVGYCKIGKWTEGEGALYVEALNVRPDYHGKKIGKALMLKSVERTTELDWPRLDLHTWPGNTKAVPLYKKTGFFWEERDREVYLVNFIPGILKNELVKDFFEYADWYRDSTRKIEIKPDGREENKFTYFTYSWEKDSRHLSMEFARRGRGLRKIDRNEYCVTATVEDLNLVFGRSYKVSYDIINRTDTPLEVNIIGQNDKNIIFDFSHKAAVAKESHVEGEFFVDKIDRIQSKWKTHPCVSALISINGKKALFKVSIVPKFPANISLVRKSELLFTETEETAYLNVENNLPVKAEFNLTIPEKDNISFPKSTVTQALNPYEKASIAIPYILHDCCVYSEFIKVNVRLENGEEISFKKEVGCNFPLHSGFFNGEMPQGDNERAYIMGNGAYCIRLRHVHDSHINEGSLTNSISEQSSFRFFAPRLGKPYSEEFIKKPPEPVTFHRGNGSITMKAHYYSDDFKGIELIMVIRLFSSGIAQMWYEVINSKGFAHNRELILSQGFRCDMNNAVLPYRNRFIETRSETPNGTWLWDNSQFTENWLFCRGPKGTVGCIWDKNARIQTGEWTLTIEHKIGKLSPGESFITKPITAAMNTFSTWRQCRDYALGRRVEAKPLTESLDIFVNGGNPFVKPNFRVNVIEYKQKNLHGTLSIFSGLNLFQPISQSFAKEEKVKNAEFNIETKNAYKIDTIDTIELNAEFNVLKYKRRRTVFYTKTGKVKTSKSHNRGYDILEADNDLIVIRSAPEFAPHIFSCTYKGNEWLHSTFPDLGPKDWWNPWIGGLCSYPSGMEARPLLKEKAHAEPVVREDTFGNKWSGIAVHIVFKEHEDYKGLKYIQYYLLLPGVPVLFNQVEVHQNTSTYFNRKGFVTDIFAGHAENAQKVSFVFTNKEKQKASITSGKEETQVHPPGSMKIKMNGRKE